MANTKGAKERAAARRINAMELRIAGASFRKIGKQLEISEAQAHRDVVRAIQELCEMGKEDAEQLRALELERLDRLLLAIWPNALRGDYGAHDRVLRIMERRAKLTGLDKPANVDLTSGGQPLTVQIVEIDRSAEHGE